MFEAHGGKLKNLMVAEEKFADKILNLPRLNLKSRQIFDLELLLNGAFSPLEGFLNENDYKNVLENMRLANGVLWSMPVVLDIFENNFKKGDEIILCDELGNPLALMGLESIYTPDKEEEARLVYGTTDSHHPGVSCLFNQTANIYIGGKVQGISYMERHDFKELRFSPQEIRQHLKNKNWDKVIGFQTRNPVHRAHFEIMKKAAKEHNAKILLHPVVGLTKEGDIDYITRVRAYKKLHEKYMQDFAMLSLLPLAMRMAGPREAVWHAIVRKNYGCTHFIVGRDHAGPGVDSSGKPFYGPYEAQEMAEKFADEIGIKIIPFKEMVYVEGQNKYLPVDEAEGGKILKISGTQFREMLLEEKEIPAWFSFPEVIEELKKGVHKQKQKGLTIFITGLPSAGKSTIASILYSKLLELQDKKITLLDGDIVRQNLSKGLGFSKEDRNINIERIGYVSLEIVKHGGIAICAAIAPFAKSRQKNRRLISENGDYVEVFVDTPLEVCKKRDTKGLYQKAEAGLIKNFTGVDDPYEKPQDAEIVLDTVAFSAKECADKIIDYLREKEML